MLSGIECNAQYYKDIFMDGGLYLSSRKELPCADYLGLSIERYYSVPAKEMTPKDSLEQMSYFVGNSKDENGVLLYPDGAPRFRVIYVNGGKAGNHGRTLNPRGLQHIRDFFYAGGSYVGTCAGAYLASNAWLYMDKKFYKDFDLHTAHTYEKNMGEKNPNYLYIYPGSLLSTRMPRNHTQMSIPEGSPLLKYFDFGGDFLVDSVLHNGGCFTTLHPEHFPEGTEVCAYYKNYENDELDRLEKGKFRLTGKISVVAYKPYETSGRAVLCGSHPEGVTEGERLDFFSSFVLYAMDGNVKPVVKGELTNGQKRVMDKKSKDAKPDYTRIGDLQYHHFTVMIPEGAKNVKIEVVGGKKGFEECNLNLFMKQGDFAFADKADYAAASPQTQQVLSFDTLPAGKWFISVQGATTPEVYESKCGDKYKGHLEVLNGVPYSVKVSWE